MAERLFIGVPITAETAHQLAQALGRNFPGGLPGRAVPPENWHVTLRFLGDVEPEIATKLHGELGAGGLGESFELVLNRLGVFPSARRARVLWVGSGEEQGPVHELAAAVESRSRRLGFEPESRPFSPHVTLARLRHAEDLRQPLASAVIPAIPVAVGEVVLYRSTLGGASARYEIVERFPL